MTIDIAKARKLADELEACERGNFKEPARTIRALCDRVEEADGIMRVAEWTNDDSPFCPCCCMYQNQGHEKDCKLAAWLRGGKA